MAIDIREKYGWKFAGRPLTTERRVLAAGDYAAIVDDAMVAVIERKTLENLATSLSDGGLAFQMQRLAEVARAAIVVEGDYPDLFRTQPGRGSWLADMLGRLAVRYPEVPVIFAGSRRFAEEWAYRFLGAALLIGQNLPSSTQLATSSRSRNFPPPAPQLRFDVIFRTGHHPGADFHAASSEIHHLKRCSWVHISGDSGSTDFSPLLNVWRRFADHRARLVCLLRSARLDAGQSHVVVRAPGTYGRSMMGIRIIGILERFTRRRARLERTPVPPGDAHDTVADASGLLELGVMPRPSTTGRRPSYVLYSHDTYGLGHLRRNTAIAHAILQQQPGSRVTLITGSAVAFEWPLPAGAEVVRLPGVVKVGADDYRPTDSRPLSQLIAKRSEIIASTLRRLRPDVFLVDHAPLGMKRELEPSLRLARPELPGTRLILGLRDILDDPQVVGRTWKEQGVWDVLRNSFDQIFVYGCRHLYDVCDEYDFPPDLSKRTKFVGYIAKPSGLEPNLDGCSAWGQTRRAADLRVLVVGGGGGDALPVFEAFGAAWPRIAKKASVRALMVAGPFLKDVELRQLEKGCQERAGLEVIRSSKSMLSLVAAADLVVSMGGYNTVMEAVQARRRMVICPRVEPRREQLMRAEIMERLGLARIVRVDQPGAAERLADIVLRTLAGPPPSAAAWAAVHLDGARRLVDELVGVNVASRAS